MKMKLRNTLLSLGLLGVLASNAYSSTLEEIKSLKENLRKNGQEEEVNQCGVRGTVYSQRRFLQKIRNTKYDATVVSFRDAGKDSFIGAALIDVNGNSANLYFLVDGGEDGQVDGLVDKAFRLSLNEGELKQLTGLASQGLECEVGDSFKSYLRKPSESDQRVYDEVVRMNSN